MSAFALTDHLLNFVAPAAFMAIALAVAAAIFMKKRPGSTVLWAQAAINFIVGVGVLAVGLVGFGRDGMMATYAALVFVCGTGQWLLSRSWRR
jgi:hypothetical protein